MGLSFIALLLYATNRGEQPKKPCERLPTFGAKDKPDEDDLEGWCPPNFAEKTRGLQARFAPGLGFEREVVITDAGASLDIPPTTKDRPRMARLALVSGNFAVAEGPKAATQCLCRPGTIVPAELRGDLCDSNWRKKQRENNWVCTKAGRRGVIPFDKLGGTLSFRVGPNARVTIE